MQSFGADLVQFDLVHSLPLHWPWLLATRLHTPSSCMAEQNRKYNRFKETEASYILEPPATRVWLYTHARELPMVATKRHKIWNQSVPTSKGQLILWWQTNSHQTALKLLNPRCVDMWRPRFRGKFRSKYFGGELVVGIVLLKMWRKKNVGLLPLHQYRWACSTRRCS